MFSSCQHSCYSSYWISSIGLLSFNNSSIGDEEILRITRRPGKKKDHQSRHLLLQNGFSQVCRLIDQSAPRDPRKESQNHKEEDIRLATVLELFTHPLSAPVHYKEPKCDEWNERGADDSV